MLRKVLSKLTPVIVMAVISTTTTTNAAITYETPSNSEFKSYMDHGAITCHTSAQYALKGLCVTTENGFRLFNGRYCVAIGTGYNAPVGTYVDIELETGIILPCVVADIKSNNDTYENNLQDKNNNSVVEFVVDRDVFSNTVKGSGTASSIEEFKGDVVNITVYSEEDMSNIDWEPIVTDLEKTSKYLITDKYSIELGGKDVYIIEYASNTDFNTMEVSEEYYNSIKVNYSVITL